MHRPPPPSPPGGGGDTCFSFLEPGISLSTFGYGYSVPRYCVAYRSAQRDAPWYQYPDAYMGCSKLRTHTALKVVLCS